MDPKGAPESPDQLGGGLRGRVSGVTRIGARAFAIGAGIVALLAFLIFYGVTKKNNPGGGGGVAPIAAVSISPDASSTDGGGFAQDIPVVPTSSPTSDVVILPSAVPDVTSPPAAAPVAVAATISPDEAAAAAAAEDARRKEEADRLAAEKARDLALDAAKRSHILTGQGVSQAGGSNVDAGSGVQQLSYAGNGATDAQGGGGTPGTSNGSYSGTNGAGQNSDASAGSGSGGGPTYTVSNALLGRPNPTNTQSSNVAANNTSFLSGPTGQYNHVQNSSNIVLTPGANPDDILPSQRFAPVSPFEITAGSVLPSELITGIDSELAGLITGMVREDIYDTKTGKYLLIPRGTKLVGLYKNATGYGSSRVLVAWQRLIFPDTTSIDLQNMSGSDVGGFAGFGGDVDNHYGKVFGAALLTSVLAAGASLAEPEQSSDVGVISPTSLAASQISQNILNIGESITNKALSIPPTVYVAKGYPFLVVVDKDIVLPGPYGRGL